MLFRHEDASLSAPQYGKIDQLRQAFSFLRASALQTVEIVHFREDFLDGINRINRMDRMDRIHTGKSCKSSSSCQNPLWLRLRRAMSLPAARRAAVRAGLRLIPEPRRKEKSCHPRRKLC
jgi:hypothetical protein